MSERSQTIGLQVGIVLVNYNGQQFLPDCLHSLAQIDYPAAVIVLVDNASTDGSADWAASHYPQIILLRREANEGFAVACNDGIRECLKRGFDYVLLLNNDTVVTPDFLTRLMENAEPHLLLVPKIYYYDAPNIINNHLGDFDLWRGIHRDWFFGRPDTSASLLIQEVGMANGCALLVSRRMLEQVGMIDEIFFMYAEDVDFILRAVHQGARILFVPDSVIRHRESSSSGGVDSPFTVYYTTRNRLFFMFRYQKNWFILLFFLIYFSLTRLLVVGRYLVRGQRAQLKALRQAVIDFFRGRMGYTSPNHFQ